MKIKGLNSEEVRSRIDQGKVNNAKKVKTYSIGRIIVKNVFSFINILLISIAAVLFSFGLWSNFGFVVVFAGNLVISLYSDIRAKRAIDKLSLIKEDHFFVFRDSKEVEVKSNEIVVDDIVKIKLGDVIPCDGEIVDGTVLLDESILTGESEFVEKKEGDKILSGTTVISGTAWFKVNKVGSDTYIQELEKQTKTFHSTRPKLYEQINFLFKIIFIVVAIIGGSQILTILLRSEGINTYQSIATRIVEPIAGSILALIPSGLYFLFSTTLGVGVINLAKKNILTQDLYSLDVLSRVDVICVDKTGTITDNTMKVVEVLPISKNSGLLEGFSQIMSSYLSFVGDSNATNKALKDYFGEEKIYETKNKISFDSIKKYSAVELENNQVVALGAYEFLPLNNKSEELMNLIKEKSSEGYRVLVAAIGEGKIVNGKINTTLKAEAIICLEDKIKDDAKDIIKYFKDKGVKVLILSGDNNLTLEKIAKDVELDDAIASIDLSNKQNEEIISLVEKYNVYGRVSPEQKRVIVKALKDDGHTVAMFGDGVNDILAFKEANVSLSIAAGTPAARSLAKIVFLDNNFSGMVDVVKEGRRVINNLQRTASLFLVKTVFAAFVNIYFILLGAFKGISWPFVPGSFYIWEIAFIGMSAFFLSLEPKSTIIKGNFLKNIMSEALPLGSIVALTLISFYSYAIFSNLFDGNADLHRAMATLIISFAAFPILIKVCLPLNRYRSIVIAIGTSLAAIILVWSIFGNDRMKLYPSETPRLLPNEALWIVLAFIGAAWATMVIYWCIIYFVKKIKEKRNA